MLLFRFEPDFNYQPTEAEMEKEDQAWGAFIGGLVMQEKLVSTHRLDFGGKMISADKVVTDGINICNNEMVGGNMVVSVASIEEAVEISLECPILSVGGTVEVREILSI